MIFNHSRIIFFKKEAILIICFFFLFQTNSFCQSNDKIDSLENVFVLRKFKKENRLKILKDLAYNHPDPDKALEYSLELIEEAQLVDSINFLFDGYLLKGNALKIKGDLSAALESYFLGAEIAYDENEEIGTINITIADVYSIMENHDKANYYYDIAIDILRKEKDSLNLASALSNAGDEFFYQNKFDKALLYFNESGIIFKKKNYLLGTAYNLGNTGMVYAEQGKNELAKENILESIKILEELKEYYPISIYLTYMSDIYLNQGDWKTAVNYSKLSLELSKKYGLKKQISDANLQLSNLFELTGNLVDYIKYYKDHIKYKDSVNNISSVQQMAALRADFEISQKQIEVDLLNEQKRTQRILVISIIVALFLLTLLAIGLFRRYRFINKTNKIIEIEKNRSETLLLNILPEETAQELKEYGKVKAKRFEMVSVLFTDFKDFTQQAESLTPEELVESIDFYFSKFDEIIEKYDLEKIKTVGDAYMCAGGLPFPDAKHIKNIILAAIEINDFVIKSKNYNPNSHARFDIRIGVNTGPVVAGVVGTKKFVYDIWGDTVNIASRMESNSLSGRINISESTYNLIKNEFDCEFRGEINVKNRGTLKMYFVNN